MVVILGFDESRTPARRAGERQQNHVTSTHVTSTHVDKITCMFRK